MTKRIIKLTGVSVSTLALLLAVGMGTAFAHTTNDAAADTPLGGQSQNQTGAVDGFFGAVDNGQAENSLVRNPTCGAHNGAGGIHPPGNP